MQSTFSADDKTGNVSCKHRRRLRRIRFMTASDDENEGVIKKKMEVTKRHGADVKHSESSLLSTSLHGNEHKDINVKQEKVKKESPENSHQGKLALLIVFGCFKDTFSFNTPLELMRYT